MTPRSVSVIRVGLLAMLLSAIGVANIGLHPASAAAANAEAVTEAYRSLLCREPSAGDLATWLNAATPIEEVRARLSASEEGVRIASVRAVYLSQLGRDPVPGDCRSVRGWADSASTIGEIRRAIMASAEYRQKRSPVNPAAVVPLPATASGPVIPRDKGYLVEEVGGGLYWVTDGAYQAMFLTTGQGVIVVDAPPSIGGNLLKAIGEVTAEPITHVVYSHAHADHIAAAGLLPASATYIAHADTAAMLADPGHPESVAPFGAFVGGKPVPSPTLTFLTSYTLNVGSQTLELNYLGNNHEPGNVFVYAPRQKVLMLVDVVFPGWVPFKDLALAKDVAGFVKAHDDVLAYDFETLIAGHLTRLGTRNDVEVQREYVLDLRSNAATALQTTDFMAIAGQTGFQNSWLLYDTYLGAVARGCEDMTLTKWLGRLGGADVFTYDHCHVMMESLRID